MDPSRDHLSPKPSFGRAKRSRICRQIRNESKEMRIRRRHGRRNCPRWRYGEIAARLGKQGPLWAHGRWCSLTPLSLSPRSRKSSYETWQGNGHSRKREEAEWCSTKRWERHRVYSRRLSNSGRPVGSECGAGHACKACEAQVTVIDEPFEQTE